MAAAAAIILRKERDIVNTYRGASATNALGARDPAELGIPTRAPFRQLVRHGVLIALGDGRFYLDDARWHALRARRQNIAFSILAVMLVVALAMLFLGIYTLGRTAAATH